MCAMPKWVKWEALGSLEGGFGEMQNVFSSTAKYIRERNCVGVVCAESFSADTSFLSIERACGSVAGQEQSFAFGLLLFNAVPAARGRFLPCRSIRWIYFF